MKTGPRLEGVKVKNMDNGIETITDRNGNFSIIAGNDEILSFQLDGFTSCTTLAREDENLEIVLENSALQQLQGTVGGAVIGIEMKEEDTIRKEEVFSIWDLLK